MIQRKSMHKQVSSSKSLGNDDRNVKWLENKALRGPHFQACLFIIVEFIIKVGAAGFGCIRLLGPSILILSLFLGLDTGCTIPIGWKLVPEI